MKIIDIKMALWRILLWIGLLGAVLHASTVADAAEQPEWALPTPPDEDWTVIQGYNCGTHTDWDRLSFDLVRVDGSSAGAPVRAVADGELWYWVPASGTLIVRHAADTFSMYTHLSSHLDLDQGAPITQGLELGTVGNTGAEHTLPHLHLTLYRRAAGRNAPREPLPLTFRDGYAFAEDGSCNQHAGAVVRAASSPAIAAEMTIEWQAPAERVWQPHNLVRWTLPDAVAWQAQWDQPPGLKQPLGLTPQAARMVRPGAHTLYVRAWDAQGRHKLFAYELWYATDWAAPIGCNPLRPVSTCMR